MNSIYSETKCLASLAVFRELYDSRKDVYAILSEFITDIVISHGKYVFSITDITSILNSEYDFSIPEAVVSTSIGRLKFIYRDKGSYCVDVDKLPRNDIIVKRNRIQSSNEVIFDALISYVELKLNTKMSDVDKCSLVNSFCSYILDDASDLKYSEYISAFILDNKCKCEFIDQLQTIKEGVILYSGIKFNNNLADIGSWRSNLVIYIDTEIIFHFAGYNGKLYKILFDDFFNYVKEINNNSKTRLIYLKYFKDVKIEIEAFFKKAEFIVTGNENLNMKNTAMAYIVNGCTSASDVLCKKTELFSLLSTSGILDDDFNDYYAEENHKYNIHDQETISQISKDVGVNDISNNIKYLNYINIRRGGNSGSNFEGIGYILLTGNRYTIQSAWHDRIKLNGNVPLATSLHFLTNKLWFKLNKGFGENNHPKSFEVITKAQIVLSTMLNNSVSKKYEDLKARATSGNLTKDQIVSSIAALRKQSRMPEEISDNELPYILESISDDNIERYINEKAHLENQIAKKTEESSKLEQDLIEKNKILQNTEDMHIETLIHKDDLKKRLLYDKRELIKSFEYTKSMVDNMIKDKMTKLKYSTYFAFVLFYVVIFVFIFKFGWNTMEPVTYMLGAAPIIGAFIYSIKHEKSYNPVNIIKNKEKTYEISLYNKYNINIHKINELKNEASQLEIELNV